MSKICEICGKKPVAGRTITRRGLAKKKGGVGQKITGITNRRFLPNLQTVRAVVKGATKRICVCVKCLKAGKVVKAI
jgi:large subunit ribosomal protein L28